MSGKHKNKRKHSDKDKSPKAAAKPKKDSQAKVDQTTSESKNLETSPSSSRASRSRSTRNNSRNSSRRVLDLDISHGQEGAILDLSSVTDHVTDCMKNTIKAVTEAGSILWTGYGKVDTALREIASSTHSTASCPVVDHGVALQDALSAWCHNIQEVQENITIPSQENLTKALAETRAHFCELQGSIRRANNANGKKTDSKEHKKLYSTMQKQIKEKVDPITESTIDEFTTTATESLRAQLQSIGVSPGALVYLLAEMINTFRGRVAALVTSFSDFLFKEAVT